MSTLPTVTSLVRRPLILIPAIIIVGGFSWYFFSSRGGGSGAEIIAVRRGSVIQEVTVPGKPKAAQSVNLALERSGRIGRASYGVGAIVEAGAAIVILDQSELAAELSEAEADVAAKEAALAEAQHGTRPEKIRIDEIKVENAKTSVRDALANFADKINDAYTRADDAIRNRVDQFISNPRSANPQLTFSTDPATELAFESGRMRIEAALNDWKAAIGDPRKTPSDAVPQSRATLDAVKSFLDTAASAVNALGASSALAQTTIDGYRSDVSTARANVNTALASITAAEEKLRTAESSLAVLENELALDRAGSTPEAIAAREADLEKAKAAVALARAQLEKTVLRAPFAGLITKQDAKPGEIVGANVSLVSLISRDRLEIEANVPEVDIGKVAVGNPTAITLDALPGERFTGKVIAVEPGETIVDGVVNYKIRAMLNETDSRQKPGLTANLEIETLRKADVLVLPQYAIIENDQGTFVRKRTNGTAVEVPVAIGVRSNDGAVEIVSGLREGDTVENVGAKTTSK